ncbi:phage tail protein [Serratia sp. Leaf50]|nr:phage tail protein [Serratia sp. Leaf50]
MTTPNPLAPTKGARTTLWVYKGTGDPYANPLSNVDWYRLAQIKDITPGELTADSYDDNYVDDDNADWASTAQGQKSAGEASFTLAWKPGETGQQNLIAWFEEGSDNAYKILYPNGVADVYTGWVSSLGKALTANEVITRTVKVTNKGKPQLAEANIAVVSVTGVTATPATVTTTVGTSKTVQIAVAPTTASDKNFMATSTASNIATVSVSNGVLTITGIAAGTASIVVVTNDSQKALVIPVTVS